MTSNIHIKTSEENQKRISFLTKKIYTDAPENLIARLALVLSLRTGKKIDLETEKKDSKGKEYKEDTLFGKYKDIYVALVCQHYSISPDDPKLPQYVKAHVDHGIELIHNEITTQSSTIRGTDYLLKKVTDGVFELVSIDTLAPTITSPHYSIPGKKHYSAPIKIEIGKLKNGKVLQFEWNNTQFRPNCHIAIAGTSGSGKTRFARHLIKEIVNKTNHQVNFLFIDFKGQGRQQENYSDLFINETNCEYRDLSKSKFPINPLSIINTINESEKISSILRFIDILTKCNPKIGEVQKSHLKTAIKNAIDNLSSGEPLTFNHIYQQLESNKPDSLTELIDRLAELPLFDTQNNAEVINNNYYLSIPSSLPENVRITAVFLVIYYIYHIFIQMEDTPNEQGYQGVRFLLVIDEAHFVFKDKATHSLLEEILRTIRSKGVGIMLISQTITDFVHKSFHLGSACGTNFLFQLKEQKTQTIREFANYPQNLDSKVKQAMEQLKPGEALTNLKEEEGYQLGTPFQTYAI
ncbi:DNA sulfur modification protein DndE [Thermonema lapsum]|uniref:DNA sulfur modification protein DndE n=1 Tax=Thermonema lapsum TaxID=28195 RepID=A0A846MP07_9BACT|nr:helicase HerA-like domain-containing protein [Thermonema lapsum]NIK73293.1 DNA sulfur modification protein DndE [Thermonema lapsum]